MPQVSLKLRQNRCYCLGCNYNRDRSLSNFLISCYFKYFKMITYFYVSGPIKPRHESNYALVIYNPRQLGFLGLKNPNQFTVPVPSSFFLQRLLLASAMQNTCAPGSPPLPAPATPLLCALATPFTPPPQFGR